MNIHRSARLAGDIRASSSIRLFLAAYIFFGCVHFICLLCLALLAAPQCARECLTTARIDWVINLLPFSVTAE
jgi:hypothetical protein